jgi:NADH-ubiquinone oxidoreductase chain 5
LFKIFNYFDFKKSILAKKLFHFFNKKWYFDRVYNEILVQKVLKESHYYFYQEIDRGLIEKLGPSGITTFIKYSVQNLKQYQSGQVLHYLSYFSFFFYRISFIARSK